MSRFEPGTTRGLALEIANIEIMTDSELVEQLEGMMEGRDYSWHTINRGLQSLVDDHVLNDRTLLRRWNFLCKEKQRWDNMERHLFAFPQHNRVCLINLILIPSIAGLGRFRYASSLTVDR